MADHSHFDDIYAAYLSEANLSGADLSRANFSGANLYGKDLSGADLSGANLTKVNLLRADLSEADLSGAKLTEADLSEADLSGATFLGANLSGVNLSEANLSGVNLSEANLSEANLSGSNLSGSNLSEAKLSKADLWKAKLSGAKLSGAKLWRANLTGADLTRASLTEANLRVANLRGANLSGADLSGADLTRANLTEAHLSGADLSGANLQYCILVRANFQGATLTNCRIYGISAWDLQGEPREQSNLVISPGDRNTFATVDDLEVAQFVYLLFENRKLRNVIQTMTSKAVLILGNFTPQRKEILEAIRERLRSCDKLPILFDITGPQNQRFIDTVTTVAHLSRFVIADLTQPRSVIAELTAITDNLPLLPIKPLILETEAPPHAFIQDVMVSDSVLKLHRYTSSQDLLASFDEAIIAPADKKRDELEMKRLRAIEEKLGDDHG